ncbi:protein-tyrosine phosphatase-like protein [Scheffersomyces xylosifermentans]|uniref:protein-tyrosine phosphatase-like protein n=1 Tax=Scheffersomyces xylosifermentans TaxID=1304137 RepID=UPI00315C69D1
MTVTPQFLRLPLASQKENFHQINELEAARIKQGLRHPGESDWAVNDGTDKRNASRNRYANVFPYNSSRVRLPVVGDGASDYINASYVRLSEESFNEYIAAQGPLENTVNQFWSMAYNESEKQNNDVVLIVMVTPLTESGMIKCDKYWPDKENPTLDLSHSNKKDSIDIPELQVNYIKESYDDVGDFLLTEMELVSPTKTKKVYHFYYYKWADARVPPSLYPLLYLSEEINAIRKLAVNAPTPIVHCSAGVGRTGTFIAIDHLFKDFDKFIKLCEKAKASKEYDVVYDPIFQTVLQMREKRMMMVQTAYQFGFLYDSAKGLYKDRFQ